MWNTFVLVLNMMLDRLISGFVDTGLRYPIATSAFLVVLVALATTLWIEALKGPAFALVARRRSVVATAASADREDLDRRRRCDDGSPMG